MLIPCRYETGFTALSINRVPQGSAELCVDEAAGVRVVITDSPDGFLHRTDQGNALRTVMARRFFQGASGKFDDLLDAEVRAITEARRKTAGDSAFIVATVDSQVEADLANVSPAHGDFRFGFDLFHKDPTRQRARQLVDRALAALYLATDVDARCDRLAECMYLLQPGGGVVYSFSATAGGSLTLRRAISLDELERVQAYFLATATGKDLSAVFGLLRAATDGATEPLRRFLAAWNAIEILTNKLFREIRTRWVEESVRDRSALEAAHFRRIAEVMKGKYRLLDKFTLIAYMLDAPDAESDVARFKGLKSLRDGLLHGGVQDPLKLPVDSLVAMTREYLRLHYDRATDETKGT